MVSTVTSYSDTSGTTAVNQILREYTDFGLLEKEYQEHSGLKDATTLYVGYNYAGASDGLRLQSIRYARLVSNGVAEGSYGVCYSVGLEDATD